GLAGESGLLPPAECWGGMQGACCLRSTLAVCPGDKPRSEFTTRPPQHSDKGTHAQRGQETRQDKPYPGPTRKHPLPYAKPKRHAQKKAPTPQSLQPHHAARNKKAPEGHSAPRGTGPIACPQAADHRYSITRLSKQTC